MSDFITAHEAAQESDSRVTATRANGKLALDVANSIGLIESLGNTTDTPLTSGSTFTGTGEQNSYPQIGVMLKTDQSGTLFFDFSGDGVNWDSTFPVAGFSVSANIPEFHTAVKLGRYFRVRFINDTNGNQTFLRLFTYYGYDFTTSNSPLNQAKALDSDAISTRPTDYTSEVALGLRGGVTTWNKFGYNEDIDTGTEEVVAVFGGAFNQRLSSGETLNIVSSNAGDVNSSGTGVRQVVLFGVDDNWDLVTEVVALNGLTPVTTTNSFIGINRMTIFTSGANNSNDGDITATASSSGNTMAVMPAMQGTTQQCIFYVPRNHQFLATWLYLSVIKSSGGGSADVTFFGRVYSDVVDSEFEVYRDSIDTSGSDSNNIQLSPGEPFVIGEMSILWFSATSSSNNTSVRGRFSGKLVQTL